MKIILSSVAVLLFGTTSIFAQHYIRPSSHSENSFAIITDTETFDKAEQEIRAYRQSVEDDGLATYIVYHNWQKPEEIRDILHELYRNHKQPLEGAVFIGNIPIPMIRGAQQLTSAFKMPESISRERSSVASDRFYDDFDLKFESLGQDEEPSKKLYHYYELSQKVRII